MLYFMRIHEKVYPPTHTIGNQYIAGTLLCRINILDPIIQPGEHNRRGAVLSNYVHTTTRSGQIRSWLHRWNRHYGRRHHIDRAHTHSRAAQSVDERAVTIKIKNIPKVWMN